MSAADAAWDLDPVAYIRQAAQRIADTLAPVLGGGLDAAVCAVACRTAMDVTERVFRATGRNLLADLDPAVRAWVVEMAESAPGAHLPG